MKRKRKPERCAHVHTMEERETSFGRVTYLRIYRDDDQPMSWREVWETFSAVYPDRWAIEVFPPEAHLLDEANVYHLFMLEDEPRGLNIRDRKQGRHLGHWSEVLS